MEDCKQLRSKDDLGKVGRLPACAYLASPFVPYQAENPPKYDIRKGLVRGTLFPGLELPFMGMVNDKELTEQPIHELQAICFAIQEIALYLDTHKDDLEALELYKNYQELYLDMRKACTPDMSPMSHQEVETDTCYRWLNSPWPWEYMPKESKNSKRR